MGNNTSKLLIWTWVLPSLKDKYNSFRFRLSLWTASETSSWSPLPSGTRNLVTTARRASSWPSVSTTLIRHLLRRLNEQNQLPLEKQRRRFYTTAPETKPHNRLERNELSRAAVRDLFLGQFSPDIQLWSGATTSNSDPHTSTWEVLQICGLTILSPEQLYTRTQ